MKGLHELARLWGVQTSYYDASGRRRSASPDTLMAILDALGARVSSGRDVAGAIRERREAAWARALEPVSASWEGTVATVTLRVPRSTGVVHATARAEDGAERGWDVDVRALTPVEEDGHRVTVTVPVPGVEPGYTIVRIADAETLLVRAPRRAAAWSRRSWGVFMPLYALRTARDRGIGDLEDLRSLLRWTADRGGDVVATLPLFARFPGDVSPYKPVSRLFWDEAWCASDQPPDGLPPDPARADHDGVRALKRRALEAALPPDAGADEELDRYARFRAAGERHGLDPERWPARALEDADPIARRVHIAAQQLARAQLDALANEDASLLFDLPLGVHPMGFDAWRYRSSFAHGVHGGAPPDGFFTKGQDWEFPPLHPERVREDGYRYPIACLRAVMSRARVLRIDHVMGFHRMWWIPAGAAPTEGTYVRNRAEEQYAILALESHRSGCAVVGEDLGTVPHEVRTTMGRRGVMRTFVLQSAIGARGLASVPGNAVASLNTHDMPPFAAFWRGSDIERRRALGLLDDVEANAERAARERKRAVLARALGADRDDERDVLRSALRALGQSRARIVLAAMDDLWGETEQHNTPGTGRGFGNWERRARYTLEEIPDDAVALLREIKEAR